MFAGAPFSDSSSSEGADPDGDFDIGYGPGYIPDYRGARDECAQLMAINRGWVPCYWCEYWTPLDFEDWCDLWPPRPLCDWCWEWHMGIGYYKDHPEVVAAGSRWCGGPYEPTAISRAGDLMQRWFTCLPHPTPRTIAEFLVPWHAP